MSVIMPVILGVFFLCVMGTFYYHDKEILSAAAYETVAVTSNKSREKEAWGYQVPMLQLNPIKGLLPLGVKEEGEEKIYEYEITGMQSMKSAYRQEKLVSSDMEEFLKQMREAVKNTEEYLLDSNRLLLDPEWIFKKDRQYYFCYLPSYQGKIRDAFHGLMEHFVQWTDYDDSESVKMAFLLHKETMRDNYSLDGVMEALGQTKKEKSKVKGPVTARVEEQEKLWGNGNYDSSEHDWISRQEQAGNILKETDNLWSPVKRFLNRHKKPKWGDWDGIYIDEEEF